MEIILILMILALAGMCIVSSEDLRDKTDLSFASWLIVGFLLAACIGFIFIVKDDATHNAIIKYEAGQYKLETKIQSDTTYFIKKVENEKLD